MRDDRPLGLLAIPRAVAAQALGQLLELDQRVGKGRRYVVVGVVDVSAAHGSGVGLYAAWYLIFEPLQ